MAKVKKFKKKVKKIKNSNLVNNSQSSLSQSPIENNSISLNEISILSGVKKHREKLKKLGFKQVSVYLPPDVYKKLKFLKLHTNKSYADILERLINEEFEKFRDRGDINIISDLNSL